MSFICTVLNSSGTSYTVSNAVLDSDGNSFAVSSIVLDSDGNMFIVCTSTQVDLGSGGEDPASKRRRYRHLSAQREDELLMMVIKEFVKKTV